MAYDINRPWLSLDPWQKEYIEAEPNQDCFLLCGRQIGKTTAMSIKSVELCMKHFKKGEMVLINSITEKQAYIMLAKAKAYARELYPKQIIEKGDEKPTKHRLMFKNGTGILCYAAGETGEGLRGFTIKKHMIDEGSRMTQEFFIATGPMMSVAKGSMDIASTPFEKHHKDGQEKFFYTCSKDENFRHFYASAEDCPRHEKAFLDKQKERLGKLSYAQEYLAMFTDELKRIFSEDWIDRVCIAKKDDIYSKNSNYFLGCDIAGLGNDECTYEVFVRAGDFIYQVDSIVERRNYTTDTSKKIIDLNKTYDFRKIGIDDGGVGFGVYSELLNHEDTKRKTIPLNNSSRPVDYEGEKSQKLLKEEMYYLLMVLGENKEVKLLDNDEVRASLASIQAEDGKIFGANSHISEGIIRGVYLAAKEKGLNIFAHTF